VLSRRSLRRPCGRWAAARLLPRTRLRHTRWLPPSRRVPGGEPSQFRWSVEPDGGAERWPDDEASPLPGGI